VAVSDWSTTPADNNSAPPNGAPEGMAPSSVNDIMRKMMADIRTFYDGANTTNDSAANVGFKGIPQNAQSGNYTLVLADAGKSIVHASGAGSGDTYTIPANASVAYPVGTAIVFVNADSNSITIAITSDTMTLAGTTTTGSRTLAQNGIATAIKVSSTTWIISGVGLT
jgi:O-glycosyl hydrolase